MRKFRFENIIWKGNKRKEVLADWYQLKPPLYYIYAFWGRLVL